VSDVTRSSAVGKRLALVAAATVLAAVFVVPATALAAKAATRIVVVKQAVADWSATQPDAPVVTVRLQKKVGRKWVALRGTIRAYRQTSGVTTWGSPVGMYTASTMVLTMDVRGRYKLTYGGSSKTKPATAYTKRLDRIGETVSAATVEYSDVDAYWTDVTLSYDVSWNTVGFQPTDAGEPLWFHFDGWFQNADGSLYSGDVYHSLELWETGPVHFTYRVRRADIPDLSEFYDEVWMTSDEPYVLITFTTRDDHRPYGPV
jgi:hypothetical protein